MNPLAFDFLESRIRSDINDRAAKAQREIKAMAECARRSLGQIYRRDRTEPYLTLRKYLEWIK